MTTIIIMIISIHYCVSFRCSIFEARSYNTVNYNVYRLFGSASEATEKAMS